MAGSTNATRADILQLIIDNVTSKNKSDRVTTEGLSEVLNCVVNELGCEIDGFLTLIQDNENAIDALELSLTNAITQEIANRIAEDANLLSQIQVLDVNLNNAITLVANDLAQEILDRAAGDAALQVLIDANSTSISSFNSDIAALQAEDLNLQTQITSNDDELTLQQNQIVSNDTDIAALQADSTSLQGQINDNDAEIASLQTDVADNTSDISTNAANIGQNTVDITALQTTDVSLQNQIITNDTDIAALQAEDVNLQIQITSNDSDISTLQSDIASNDADIAALQSEGVNLQSQIDSNDTDIAALQAEDLNLQTQITSNDDDILALQNSVSTNASDIATLQADNLNLQTQINTNDAELNSQQNQITDNDADIAALQGQVNTLSTGFVVDVELVGNDLRLLDTFNNVVGTPVDLSVYLDNTNLPRIVTASLDQNTGLVDFVRDDGSDFCLDLSPLQAEAGIQSIVAGTNITVDNTDPQNPVISASGGGASVTNTSDLVNDGSDGTSVYVEQDELGSAASANVGDFATAAQGALADSALQSVVAGTGVTIDNTDPQNPVINSSGSTAQTTGTFNVTAISGATGSFANVSGTGTWYRMGDVVHIKMNFLGLNPDPSSTGGVVISTDLPFTPSGIPQDLNVGEMQGSGVNFFSIVARITSTGAIVFRYNDGGNDINIPYPIPTANSFSGNIHGTIFI